MSAPSGKPKAIVIGGGIGGLSSAYFLQKHADVTLLEASSRWGGVIRTIRENGFLMEAGPDCFISEKPAALKLAQELGLESELIGTQPNFRQSYILKGKKLIAVPQGFYLMAPKSFPAFFFSSMMSWSGKFRALDDMWLPARKDTSDESLSSFVVRRFGREMLERVAQPMVAGIYTANPDTLSLAATMPRFLELEQKFGSVIRGLRKNKQSNGAGTSGPRYGLFVSFKNGMETLVEGLVKKLAPSDLQLNTKVEKIEKNTNGKWSVSLGDGKHLECDLLYLALPSHRCAALLTSISPTLSGKLLGIPYSSSGTLNLVYKMDQIQHPMKGMGFVIPYMENRKLVATSFSFRKFENRAPEGFALLRAFIGGAMHEDILQKSDAELTNIVHKDLSEILSIEGEPVSSTITRWNQSMAQYTLGHIDRVREIEQRVDTLPGLYLVGNGYHGIGIPDVIACAGKMVEKAFPAS